MADLVLSITADDNTAPGVSSAQKRLAGLQKTGKMAMTGIKVAGAAAAVAVGAVAVAAFDVSNQTQQAARDIEAAIGATTVEAEHLADVAKRAFGNNFFDSVEEASGALISMSHHLKDVTGQEQEILQLGKSIADAFTDIEIEETWAAAGVLMEEFGLTAEQALDFITTGMQKGLNKSGDFLDSIGEYANLFATNGAEAGEFFSIMETGIQGGVLGTDKISDAFKEFGIRVKEGAKGVAESFAAVGMDYEGLMTAVQEGEMTVTDVFNEFVNAAGELEDPLERNRALVGAIGTMAEDLGENFATGIDAAKTSLEDMEGQTQSLEVQYDTTSQKLQSAWKSVVVAMTPITDAILDWTNEHLPTLTTYVEENIPKIQKKFEDLWAKVEPFAKDFGAGATTVVTWLKGLSDWVSQQSTGVQVAIYAIGVALAIAFGPTALTVAAVVLALAGVVWGIGWLAQNADEKFPGIVAWFEKLEEFAYERKTKEELGSERIEAGMSSLKAWLDTNVGAVTGYFTTIKEAFGNMARGPEEAGAFGILAWLTSLGLWLATNTESIGGYFDDMREKAKGLLEFEAGGGEGASITDWLTSLGLWLSTNAEAIGGYFDTIRERFGVLIKGIAIGGGILAWLTSLGLWLAVNTTALGDHFDDIKEGFGVLVEGIAIGGGILAWLTSLGLWLATNTDTIGGYFDTIKERAGVVLDMDIGGGLLSWLTSLGLWLSTNTEPIGGYFDTIKERAGVILGDMGVDGGLLAWLTSLGLWLAVNTEEVGTYFSDLKDKALVFIRPFGEDGDGATVLSWMIDLFAWLGANEEALKSKFTSVGTAIVEGLGPDSPAAGALRMLQDAVVILQMAWDPLAGYFDTQWSEIGQTFKDKWRDINSMAVVPLMGAVPRIQMAWEGIAQWFVTLWNGIGLAFALAWMGITDILFPTPSYGEQIATVWSNVVTGIQAVFVAGANAAISVINELVKIMNTPLKAWNELEFKIKGFSVQLPSREIPFIGRVGGGTLGWPGINIGTSDLPMVSSIPQMEVPALAKGGIVTSPTLAMIGEAGPEAVIPLGKGGGPAMSTTVVVNVNVEGSVVTEEEFETKIVRTVNAAVSQGALVGV